MKTCRATLFGLACGRAAGHAGDHATPDGLAGWTARTSDAVALVPLEPSCCGCGAQRSLDSERSVRDDLYVCTNAIGSKFVHVRVGVMSPMTIRVLRACRRCGALYVQEMKP